MLPEQQARFIGVHLGPAFEENDIKTKILIYDHNADRPDYPISVLRDSLANPSSMVQHSICTEEIFPH